MNKNTSPYAALLFAGALLLGLQGAAWSFETGSDDGDHHTPRKENVKKDSHFKPADSKATENYFIYDDQNSGVKKRKGSLKFMANVPGDDHFVSDDSSSQASYKERKNLKSSKVATKADDSYLQYQYE